VNIHSKICVLKIIHAKILIRASKNLYFLKLPFTFAKCMQLCINISDQQNIRGYMRTLSFSRLAHTTFLKTLCTYVSVVNVMITIFGEQICEKNCNNIGLW
jgi:hypothetical protein